MSLKHLALRVSVRAVTLLRQLYHGLGRGWTHFWRPWRLLARFSLKLVLLPPYIVLQRTRLWFNRLDPQSLQQAHLTINTAVVLAAILVGTAVLTTHAQGTTARETLGQGALIGQLLEPTDYSDDDQLWEEGPLPQGSAGLTQSRYLEPAELEADPGPIVGHPTSTDPLAYTSGPEDSLIAMDVPPSTVRTRSEVETYTVQSGDTLGSIARQFGLQVATLLWSNNLTERSVLRIGQTLTIPPVNGVVYTVRKGDTLAGVAKRYGVSAEGIVEFNKLAGQGLAVGDTIIVPGGRPVPAAPATRPVSNLAQRVGSIVVPPAAAPSRATRLLWPTTGRRITQYFSWRHSGVDVGTPQGQPIYAADDGVVVRSQWNSGYGYNVVIDHGGGMRTLYGHASQLLVKAGQQVTRGSAIALIGSTGRSTGPHVHFEVIVGGVRQNPLSYTR